VTDRKTNADRGATGAPDGASREDDRRESGQRLRERFATPLRVEQPGAAELQQSAVAFRELLRLLGGDAVVGDISLAVVFTQESERLMRPVLARYGFDRLPATYGELFALFEYCDSLDAASGVGMRPKDQLDEWQAASLVSP
jgi:hypothetical protein